MSEDPLGADYVDQAARYLKHARESLEEGRLPVAVRLSQESTELSLKAALRWGGIDYPRDHDVADVLLIEAKRFPVWFRKRMELLAPPTSELARRRGISMYGLEVGGTPPSRMFGDVQEVERFVELASDVLELARRLYGIHRNGR